MKFDDDLDKMCTFESHNCMGDENGSSGVLSDGAMRQSDLRLIVEVIARVVKFDKPIFLPRAQASKQGKRVAALERDILEILMVELQLIKDVYPNHQFNPLVEAFFKLERGLINELGCQRHEGLSDDDRGELRLFVESLVVEVKGDGVKTRLNAFARVANKNYQGLKAYIDSLFVKYSRILVVRLDVGYRVNFCSPIASVGMSYEDVRGHRDSLFQYLKRKDVPGLIGYVWKLEYGLFKTYHYHLLLFFDGAKSQQDITIAKEIGEYWIHDVTRGAGIYYNCNVNKADYERLGILGVGMISHNDSSLRKGLATVAAYLTKVDYFVRMLGLKGGRCFGKGSRPKISPGKRGRPRKSVKFAADDSHSK